MTSYQYWVSIYSTTTIVEWIGVHTTATASDCNMSDFGINAKYATFVGTIIIITMAKET